MNTYPADLEVEVTNRHLRVPKKDNPLEQAFGDALKAKGLPYDRFDIGLEQVLVYRDGKLVHHARYWIPDDLWKLVVRHQLGRAVKPGLFVLKAIYIRKEVAA